MPIKTDSNNFIVLFIVNFVITFCFSVNDIFFPLYLGSFSHEAVTFGLAFSLYSLSKIALTPLTGKLLDKTGAEKVLLFSLFAYTAVSCSFYFVHDAVTTLGLRILQGAACAMFRPVIYYLLNSDSEGQKGRTMGNFDLSFYSALAVAPISGGFLINNLGFSGIFLLMFFCCLLSAALFICCFRKSNKTGQQKKISPPGNISSEFSVNLIMFYIFCRSWGISTVAVFLPLILHDAGMGIGRTGIIIGTTTAVTAVTLPFTGRLADSVRKETLILTGGLAVSTLLPFFAVISDYRQLIILAAASGFFSAVSQPASSALMLERTDKSVLGQTVGRFGLFMGLGSASAPVLGSMLFHTGNIKTSFFVSAALGTAASLMFLLSGQEQGDNPAAKRKYL